MKRLFLLPLLCWLAAGLLSWYAPRPAALVPVLAAQAEPPAAVVVRIRAATIAEAARLARSDLDLLEFRDGDDLFAVVDESRRRQLLAEGWDVRLDPQQTALLAAQADQARLSGLPGYRSLDQTYQLLDELAATYPGLVQLVDYGDSYQKTISNGGYDLRAIRLTNRALGAEKPRFVLLAAIHSREIATDEVAMRFVRYLLAGYGQDADATWLLDDHEIVVIPVANPDGRKIVDDFSYYHRKNTRPTGECNSTPYDYSFNHSGVDLNRNSSFGWGAVDSITNRPVCDARYPGSSAASEPEVAALEAFIRTLFADRRGVGAADAAPADTSGLLISLHSYADLVLWPWGNQASPAPNAEGLERLGRKFAAFNGYTPSQSIGLYPTSGTTDDWSYGELGVASFTFEIGPSFGGVCSGFFPTYECLDARDDGRFWPRNLPALLYAARVARAPYLLPAGSEVVSLTSQAGRVVTLTAVISGNTPLAAAEAYLDRSPYQGGTPIALTPVDGAFDSPGETVQLLQPAGANLQRRLVLVRARSGEQWGPFSATFALLPIKRPYNFYLPLFGN